MKAHVKKEQGFALMTVMLMTALLLVLMISLISLTSQSLYRATAEMEKSALVPVAEAAINETILRILDNPKWGTNKKEAFVMISGDQDTSIAGLKHSSFFNNIEKAEFSIEEKGCYYITFNPNDTNFVGKPYYSVNNLESTSAADGWRGPGTVPPNTADIVVTVAVGRSVKHVEVILKRVPTGGITNGSRGKTFIYSSIFTFDTKNDKPVIHANFENSDDPISMKLAGTATSRRWDVDLTDDMLTGDETWKFVTGKTMLVKGSGTFSAVKNISKPSDGFQTVKYNKKKKKDEVVKLASSDILKENQDPKDIPVVDVITLHDSINFSGDKLPSGEYKFEIINNVPKINRYDDKGNFVKELISGTTSGDGTAIVPGVKIKVSSSGKKHNKTYYATFNISGNVEVAFDPNDPTTTGETGNLKITDMPLRFDSKQPYTLFAPGNVVVNSGSSWSAEAIVSGKGNVYSMGTIDFEGRNIDVGVSTDSVALYAGEDINIRTEAETKFRGLIYALGNCNFTLDTSTGYGSPEASLSIEGAIIAAGYNDPDGNGGNLIINADRTTLTYDSTVLGQLKASGGGTSGFTFLSWHEF